ncbi:MAG: hypothetical protein KGM24_01015 [Elusimicrobia bacterium]|nr:hypothetical protein [Elusimicrobiota bacterium]
MTPYSAVVAGGLAGLAGAALAHVLTAFVLRAGGGAWLSGPFGPPFLALALNLGFLYGAIGAGAAPARRAPAAALGFLGPFLGLSLPLFVISRMSLPSRVEAVGAVYVLALWGTIAALGVLAARTRGWRGALAAVLGSLAAYLFLTLVLMALPGYDATRWSPLGWLPSPVNLLDGLLSGAGLCLALSLDELLLRKTKRRPA